jgi:hypothetical protein
MKESKWESNVGVVGWNNNKGEGEKGRRRRTAGSRSFIATVRREERVVTVRRDQERDNFPSLWWSCGISMPIGVDWEWAGLIHALAKCIFFSNGISAHAHVQIHSWHAYPNEA